jgi:3-methyladenine DNA glycosylase AlkD
MYVINNWQTIDILDKTYKKLNFDYSQNFRTSFENEL